MSELGKAANLRPGIWRRASSLLPRDVEIDVLFVNPTFDPPAIGFIYNAMIHEGAAISPDGKRIIDIYIEFWKYSELDGLDQ